MEIESVFGVPAHPLMVHIPVVCIPLAAIGAVVLALVPRLRRAYGPVVVTLAAIGAIGAQLATSTGESLQDGRRVRGLGDHPELGETARTVAFLLLALVAVLYVVDRYRDHERLRRLPRWVAPVIAALTVVGAAGATVSVIAAGHSGAKVVWDDERDVTAHPGP